MPPAIRDADPKVRDAWYASTVRSYTEYEDLVDSLSHLPRKQAREAARSVLPSAVETRGVVTGNIRAWANIIPLRAAAGADAEMQEVTRRILDVVEPVAPSIFREVRVGLKENERNWS